MADEAEILTPALETAITAWEEWKKERTILSQYPPPPAVLDPLARAIESTDEFKKVAGRPVFTGYSGVVLTGGRLADEFLYRADAEYRLGIPGAIDWLLRVFNTKIAKGLYEVAIWGMAPDKEIEIAKGWTLKPYDGAPDSPIKQKLKDFIRAGWNGAVWHSTRFYDTPGAILTRIIPEIPYLGRPDLSYQTLYSLDMETRDRLAFLQVCFTGTPLIGASWFSYEDHELDFNSIENRLQWLVPEVEPIVKSNVAIESTKLAGAVAAHTKLPGKLAKRMIRSADRFVLSQCRYRRVDVAIDLAIAYELLAGSKGDGPISWKVSLRTAQLIGGTLDERVQIREKVNALYRLRNDGAHGGTPTEAEAAEESVALLDAGNIYRRLADTILQLGDEPDWSKFELDARVRE